MKLNKLDMAILGELDNNARQPLARVGVTLGASKQRIFQRVKRLEREQIIKKFVAVINTYTLGYSTFKLFVRLLSQKDTSQLDFLNFLITHKNCIWIVETQGKYDIVCSIIAKNIFEFSQILDLIREKFGKSIIRIDIAPIAYAGEFSRKYFLESMHSKISFAKHGASNLTNKTVVLDNLDKNILVMLAENARVSLSDMANANAVAVDTVNQHLKKLMHTNVISGFRLMLDHKKIGFIYHKILFYTLFASAKKEQEFFEFCKLHNQITFFTKSLGPWQIEIEVDWPVDKNIFDLISEIRTNFSGFIADYVDMTFINEHKLNYLPNRNLLD